MRLETSQSDDCSVAEFACAPNLLLAFRTSVASWRYTYVKRAFDIVFSLTMILAFALPGLLIAAVVVLTSSGPAFYNERRIGRKGRPFRLWKFRSMYRDAATKPHITVDYGRGKGEHWRMHKHLKDPRITWVGGHLREWSLDELPQLLNVLKGDMSMVGPRPIVQSEVALYGEHIKSYLEVLPGLSGLWQVSGRSKINYNQRAQLDTQYVEDWSLSLDFAIFLRTIPAVLSRLGAY